MTKELTWNQYAGDLPIPDGWEDSSSGNDACPSFIYNDYQIFYDHPDPKERETPEWTRFNVTTADGWSFDTDDFNEVLKIVDPRNIED